MYELRRECLVKWRDGLSKSKKKKKKDRAAGTVALGKDGSNLKAHSIHNGTTENPVFLLNQIDFIKQMSCKLFTKSKEKIEPEINKLFPFSQSSST